MEQLKDYEQHIERALDWFWNLLPNLLLAAIILIVGLWVIKFINRLVRKFFEKKDYDPALESFLQSFIRITLKVLLLVLVVTQLGVKTSSLVAMIGAAGLAIGLALQGSLANFAGGVLILLFKPFRIGDWISAQGVDGAVKEISIFNTKLNTFGNQIAIIPNGQLANGNIINYNAEPMRRENYVVGIGYGSNIKTAKDILLDICANDGRILKEPAPEVYVDSLGDSSVNLTLRFWAPNEVFWPARFNLIEQSKLRFDEAGIEIPFPQRVVHQIDD
ncbi:mechanosensitive ion channel family protein [Allomuricauda sp. SCSIO 65647]|uniref:mechanosensitive ion channel family protein n=1 Tax=Allomuricauda sp. SCSIO 65647 TaxID=2908843 RepID=UPI001F1BBAA2|nr:mechanosensitive ion channel domain-containing protein [Muricauda sp. SCSIO 65647]UJH68332.1 mechanosensitive ion channel [Muricauda sp. SCSIO 65647]